MNPLWIILIGMTVVVGGILALRLHAFLALIGGALVVALITPAPLLFRFALRSNAIRIDSVDQTHRTLTLTSQTPMPEGSPLLLYAPATAPGGYRQIATLRVTTNNIAEFVSGDWPASFGANDFVLDAPGAAAARKTLGQTIGARVADGFGRTALQIGILIALAAIVGETLLISGSAERIIDSFRRLLGDRHAGLAFLFSGFLLGIPVFFDTVFYLLIPLVKVMRARSGRDYTLYVLATVAGATMTHSLVPPTPGPLAAAAMMQVDLATMIVCGLAIGIVAASAGYLYALWANRAFDLPMRASMGMSEEQIDVAMSRDPARLPPLWLALSPLLLPVILITTSALVGTLKPSGWGSSIRVLDTLGEKNVSMCLGAIIGLLLAVGWRDRQQPRKDSIGAALGSAGVIILITSAGGAFGFVLRQTDIASTIKEMMPVSKLALLPLAFVVTAAVRTAQGSATVAMITAAGILSPIAAAGGLGFHPVYLAMAVGCGSKLIPWMNDSGFWIIGKMSGFTEAETLKTASAMMTIMGIVGLAATMLAAWLVPLM